MTMRIAADSLESPSDAPVRGELEAYARTLNIPEAEISARIEKILAIRAQLQDLPRGTPTGTITKDYVMKADRDSIFQLGLAFLGEKPESTRALTEGANVGRAVLDILFRERQSTEKAEDNERTRKIIEREKELTRRRTSGLMAA